MGAVAREETPEKRTKQKKVHAVAGFLFLRPRRPAEFLRFMAGESPP